MTNTATPLAQGKTDPLAQHQHYLQNRRAAHATVDRINVQISLARLLIFVVVIVVAVASFAYGLMSPWWLAGPLTVFVGLLLFHDRVIKKQAALALRIKHHVAALRRLDGSWPGHGVEGLEYLPKDHPYAADLDLFGSASMFELLCTAPTRAGQAKLASWLNKGADLVTLEQRKHASQELAAQIELREELTVIGAGVPAELDPSKLIAWAESPPAFSSAYARLAQIGAGILALAAVTTAVAWLAGLISALPLMFVATLEFILGRFLRRQVQAEINEVEKAADQLHIVVGLLKFFEQHSVQSERLQKLQQILRGSVLAASAAIAGLRKRVQWLESRRNAFFAPLAFLLMWSLFGSLAILHWRRQYGARVALWLDALAEFEALNALAGYGYEHPQDVFADLVDDVTCFRAVDLGHPLLADDKCVKNSVALDSDGPVWLVSGSNMSGKSTLLRSVGINTVLALAGAPVRAHSLQISPLQIGCSIRFQDSLHEGASRFYAEISRLKLLQNLGQQERPLLFLIDEILAGTNSRDRRQGAASLISSFVAKGALGLVTTHDLAIAENSEKMKFKLKNVHFEDQVEAGQLSFDYQLRPGQVTGSNALTWMRAIGLDV